MEGRLLPQPIFPPPPYTAEDLKFWGRQFTEAVAVAFEDAANRIETLNQTETTEGGTQPDAAEKRTFYYDETLEKLYFDDGTWRYIGGPAAMEDLGDHIVHNTGHPNIVVNSTEPADSTLDVNEGCFWYVLV